MVRWLSKIRRYMNIRPIRYWNRLINIDNFRLTIKYFYGIGKVELKHGAQM